MHRKPGLALLCAVLPYLALCACAVSLSKTPVIRYQVTDLSDDFAVFMDRTARLAKPERVAAFKSDFIPLLPQFYGRERFAALSDAQFDARISGSLTDFAAIREAYTRTAGAFQDMLVPALRQFQRELPGLRSLPPIYLLHSLGEMDGGTRSFNGNSALVFGADVMASHNYGDERPFLHHELFHVYHQQFFAGCDELWCSLWVEGLAVYAAQQLNPRATDDQLLLTLPEPIRAQVDAHLVEVVCAVRQRLDSKDAADQQALFGFKRLNAVTPPRAGYYVGYLAARRAGATLSLEALARLANRDVQPLLMRTLTEIAACP